MDLNLLLSIGTTLVLVAVTWGAQQAKIRFICAQIQEMKTEKVSTEKLDGIVLKIESLEARLVEKISNVDEKIHDLKEDLSLKKN